MDDKSNVERAQDKAKEKVVLSRKELWMLRIAALTGVMSFISHGIQLLHQLL